MPMIRSVFKMNPETGMMDARFIFRDDNDLSKDYSDFNTMEKLCNKITAAYNNPNPENDSDAIVDQLKDFDLEINKLNEEKA